MKDDFAPPVALHLSPVWRDEGVVPDLVQRGGTVSLLRTEGGTPPPETTQVLGGREAWWCWGGRCERRWEPFPLLRSRGRSVPSHLCTESSLCSRFLSPPRLEVGQILVRVDGPRSCGFRSRGGRRPSLRRRGTSSRRIDACRTQERTRPTDPRLRR